MSKLPPRARSQAEDVDAADAVAPPSKLPRTGRSCVSHAGNPVSQGAGPFRRDELSSGDSGDSGASTDNIPSGTSGPPTAPLGNHNLESSAEAPVPSSQYNQAVNTANDETAVGEGVVVEKVNPKQGPTVGGPEIWISGSNFPTDPRPLYVRFGVNPARVVSVLSPSFVKYLIASRPFKYLACCSRALCRQPMFQARSKYSSPAVPTPELLFWAQVFVNLNTSLILMRCESRHPPLPLLI